MKKQYKYRSFVPWPENEKRLEKAQTLGLNMSEILNEALEQRFDDILKQKSKRIQAALVAVPA
jgi:hypothetical protein